METVMIKITDDWYLDSDPHQWIIKRSYWSKKHKTYLLRDFGYYPTLSRACDALSDELPKGEAVSDLKTLTHAIDKLSDTIRAQAQEVISLSA